MTIDEAILHAEEVAEGYEEDISKWEYTLSEYRKRECVEQTTIPRCEKALNKCKQCASEHRQLAEWLKDYKRLLEQEPKWIPVSERLPKAGEYVGDVDKYYLVQNEYGDMMVARYTHSEYWEQIYQLRPIGDKIVAWMPLPKPYESQERSEE